MTWKRFFIACSLCVIASIAFAAPTITMMGGRLNLSQTARVWNIAVAPDLLISPGGTPLALELGFRATGGNILMASAAQNMPPEATRVERENPGEIIFGWETLSDLGDGNMKPVGVQVGTGADANSAVAFLGSGMLSMPRRYDLLTIRTEPAVTSLAWGGRYNADGSLADVGAFVNGRIAQGEGESAVNFNTFAGVATIPGVHLFVAEMNGDGILNFGDLAGFGASIVNPSAYRAAFPHLNRIGRCDVNDDGKCNFGDLAAFGRWFGPRPFAAGATLAAAAVPEPSSLNLIALGIALAAGLRRQSVKRCFAYRRAPHRSQL